MYLNTLDTDSPVVPDRVELYVRQTAATTTALPTPGCGGQYSGGALAGAILGTFFGTLLVIYMFSVIKPIVFTTATSTEEVVVEKRRRHTSRS